MSTFITKHRLWLCLLCVALTSVAAKAQQYGLYAMGSLGHIGGVDIASNPNGTTTTGSLTAGGGTFGLYDNFARVGPLNFGGDARYETQSSSSGHLHEGLVGVRLALRSPILQPYVQAEIGGGGTNYGFNTGSLASQFQFGADYTLVPHISLRGEYGIGRLSAVFHSNAQTVQQFGLGLVVRLP